MKDLLYGFAEEPGEGNAQRQGRDVPTVLDRIYGLPRDPELLGQLPLR